MSVGPPTPNRLLAEFTLSHPELPLSHTIRTVSGVRFWPEFQPVTDPDRPTVFVRVGGREFASLESALEEDPTVADWSLSEDRDDTRLYRIALDSAAIVVTPTLTELGIRVLRVASGADGWTFSVVLPDRESLAAFREHSDARDVEFGIERLSRTSGGIHESAPHLRAEQLDLLVMAYLEGYFEVPRRITQAELAERMDVSASAISQRLRRAIAGLIADVLLESPGDDRTP